MAPFDLQQTIGAGPPAASSFAASSSGNPICVRVHLQQTIGEEGLPVFLCLKLLGNYRLQGFFCLEGGRWEFQVGSLLFARSCSGISTAKCRLASS